MSEVRTCIITGANGYIGQHLATALERNGFHIIELGRRPGGHSGRTHVAWNLGDPIPWDQLSGATALIHAAWDLSPMSLEEGERINVRGSARLLEEARDHQVRHRIFISTVSAYPGTPTVYGKTKLRVEKTAQDTHSLIIRPGLVYGTPPGGLVAALDRVARKLPVIPIPGSGRQKFFLCAIEDLSGIITDACADRSPAEQVAREGKIVTAADRTPVEFREIILRLAREHGKRPLLIPVPWKPAYWMLRALEGLSLRLPFKSDSLLSMMHLNPDPDFTGTDALVRRGPH